MNVKSLLVAAAFTSSFSFASDLRALRSFDCQGRYNDLVASTGTGPVRGVMTDYANEGGDESNMDDFIGYFDIDAGFLPLRPARLQTEEDSNDIESDRDSDPEERDGWGGLAIYGMLLKGTIEEPREGIMFAMKADKEQIGARVRTYKFFAQKVVSGGDDDTNSQIPLAEGTLRCTLKN